MKTIYNGKKNHVIIRDFYTLCKNLEENRKEITECLKKNGYCWVQTHLDFFGCPDEFSKNTQITSEEEMNNFLKQDFEERFTEYLKGKDISDPLLTELYSFIKTNTHWPSDEEMTEIKKSAETKRLESGVKEEKEGISMGQLIKNEIMQLAIEIYTLTERSNPNPISHRVEPYPSILHIFTDRADIKIFHQRYYPCDDDTDYRVLGCAKKRHGWSDNISFVCDRNTYTSTYDRYDNVVKISKENFEDFIILHREISKIAEEKGFEFTTEVDYTEIMKHQNFEV